MGPCDEYAALLDPFVDGELTAEELARVQVHLATCPACQSYVDDALAIRAAFPTVEEAEVPAGFAQSVREAICSTPQTEVIPRPARKGRWARVLAPLAACCAVVILLSRLPLSGSSFDTASSVSTAAEAVTEVYSAADGAETAEAADDAPTAASSAVEDAVAESDTAQTESLYGSRVAAKEPDAAVDLADSAMEEQAATPLTLTAAEVGSLLADETPVELTDTAWTYELTADVYAALLEALDLPADTMIGDTVQVIVTQP